MFAPQTGVKTRKQLGRALDDAADLASGYAEDAGGYLKDQAVKLSGEAQKNLKMAADKATELANTALDQGSAQMHAVKSMF